MDKKYSLVFVAFLGVILSGLSQVIIFSENMGTGMGDPAPINASAFQNSGTYSYIGDVDTRYSSFSNGYTDASGERNVYFTNQVGRFFEISGINTIGYTSLTLSLGHYKSTNASSNELAIEVSTDGITYTSLAYSRASGNATSNWMLIHPIGTIPSTPNLRIRFTQTSVSAQFRIDDVKLTGTISTTNYVDFCNFQSPQNGNISTGAAFNVYAQVYETGVTEAIGPGPGITAWIGYNSINNNPNSVGWTWIPATYHADEGNNDEYIANIGTTLASGIYYYASRFQIDGGPYRYGGHNETGGGFWNGTTNVSGVLSVDTVDFCNLQFPGIGTINLGDPFSVYGQVYEEGVTPGTGQGTGIVAEVGYSTSNSDPRTWISWIAAAYNGSCADCNLGQNDEYSADIGSAITIPGRYYYATRFRLNGGIWLYGGILNDGTSGSFWDGSTYISGVLDVTAPEIRVEGNVGTFPEIVNGDMTPRGTDNTLYLAQYIGASQSKSYRIWNLGNLNLNISNVSIVGANPEDFTITVIPDASISPGTYSILEIEFSPLVAGQRNALVNIANDDPDENPYTFAIRGTGLCVATSNTIIPASGPAGTIATITGTNFDGTTLATINGIPLVTTLINSTTIEVTIPNAATTGNIVVLNAIGCTSNIPFTVINNHVGGCEGTASLSDLFISEITDATTGGLSYIEIYNGTGISQNLEGYSIAIYSNGASTASSTIALTSYNLPNNAAYVLAIGVVGTPTPSNSCLITGGNGQLANQNSPVSGINKKDNEHDVIRLLKSGGTVVVDQFGVYMDKNWMDATFVTGDRGFNFRRLNTSSQLPNPNFDLNDWNIIDWVGSGPVSCSTNDYSDIGIYDYSGGSSPTVTLHPQLPNTNCQLNITLSVSGIEGLAGGLPIAYQWYYNAPGTSNWVEILNSDSNYSGQQTENLKILNTLNSDGYQYYAQIRENTSLCYTASNTIRLKLESTTWDGFTWSRAAPNSNTIAILNGNYTTNPISGSFTGCSLLVNSGYTLNITENYYVEINNDVIVQGNSSADFGEIVVETKGSFVQRGDGSDAGTFRLNNTAQSRANKTTALKQRWYDYTYWGSPVINETVESVLAMASPSRRFYFDASNYEDTNGDDVDDNGDDWQLATGRMIPGVGYASTSNSSGTFPRNDVTVFNGEFNNGDISVAIHTNNIPTDRDWNFLGNPYASAINFKLVHSGNVNVIEGAAYLWSQASPPLTSNPGNQVLNFNKADYAIISIGSGNIAGGTREIPSDFIPSGQGFFVIGINSGGTLTFKNSMRMADAMSNSRFFRNDTSHLPNKFWIDLTSDNGIFNQVLVAYVEGATDEFDGFAFDAVRNSSSGVSAIIYTQISESDKKFAIQGKAITSLTLDEEVALGFKTTIPHPTIYTLSLAQLQGQFLEENMIFLKDNLLNRHHNLTNSDYQFTSTTGEFNDRFVIVFKAKTLSLEAKHLDPKELSIIELNNGQVQFSVGHDLSIESVEIMDLSGRSLYHVNGAAATEIYDLRNLSQAAYIARVTLSNGQTIIKRSVKRQ